MPLTQHPGHSTQSTAELVDDEAQISAVLDDVAATLRTQSRKQSLNPIVARGSTTDIVTLVIFAFMGLTSLLIVIALAACVAHFMFA